MRAIETRIPDDGRLQARVRCLWGGLVLIAIAILSSGCGKEEARAPEESLVGRWEFKSVELKAGSGPGDGSYLEFGPCSSGVCTGTDYLASNKTTSTFTWRLEADGRKLTIEDPSPDGGYYNNTWEILDFSEASFRMTAIKAPFPAVFELQKVQ